MDWIQILCLLALLWGAVRGWKNGLVKELLSTGGFFVGLYLAWKFHDHIAGGGIVGFLIIAIGTPIVLEILAWLLSGFLNHVFLVGTLNHFAGAVVGVAKWLLLFYAIDYVCQHLGFHLGLLNHLW